MIKKKLPSMDERARSLTLQEETSNDSKYSKPG